MDGTNKVNKNHSFNKNRSSFEESNLFFPEDIMEEDAKRFYKKPLNNFGRY